MAIDLDPGTLAGLDRDPDTAVGGRLNGAGYGARTAIPNHGARIEKHYRRKLSALAIDFPLRHFGPSIDFDKPVGLAVHEDARHLVGGFARVASPLRVAHVSKRLPAGTSARQRSTQPVPVARLPHRPRSHPRRQHLVVLARPLRSGAARRAALRPWCSPTPPPICRRSSWIGARPRAWARSRGSTTARCGTPAPPRAPSSRATRSRSDFF